MLNIKFFAILLLVAVSENSNILDIFIFNIFYIERIKYKLIYIKFKFLLASSWIDGEKTAIHRLAMCLLAKKDHIYCQNYYENLRRHAFAERNIGESSYDRNFVFP